MARELNVRELLELERQIYQESIDRVLQQQEKLNDGVLEDFVRRCKPFEEDRERELEVAQNQLEFSKSDAQTLLEFDLQQAEDVFRTQREQLKLKLLERVRRKRARIQKRLKALDEEKIFLPTSNLKRQVHDVVGVQTEGRLSAKLLEKQLERAQKRTRKNFNFRHLSDGVLPTPERIVEDVMEQCEKFQRYREHEEAVKMAQEEGVDPMVQVEINEDEQKLSCRWKSEDSGSMEDSFCVGDGVVLTSRLTEEDFHGFVSAITTEEVKLVLVCGTHARVATARLRCGQCILHKQPVEKRKEGEEVYYAKIPPPGIATSLEELLRDPPDVRRRAAAIMNRLKRKTTIDIRRGF